MAVDILDNYNDYHHATEVHDYKENEYYRSRKFIFAINTQNDFLDDSRFCFNGDWVVIYCRLAVINYGSLLLLNWYFLFIRTETFVQSTIREVFSGFTMGFMITLICVYINTFEVFNWSAANLWGIFLVALPNTCYIANLMLANNICDLEEDENNKRYTLVHYLGKASSLKLFVGLNTIAMLAILLAVGLGLTPPTMLLMLLTLPFVRKQTQALLKEQVKSKTFVCAVKILAVGATAQVLFFAIGLWWL